MPTRVEEERQTTIRTWLEMNGLSDPWVDKNSITSPNWCDSTTWPSQDPLASLWTITAKGVAYPGQEDPPDDKVIFIPELRVRFSEDAVMLAGGSMLAKFWVATYEVASMRCTYTQKRDFVKRCTSFAKHDTETEFGGDVTSNVWDLYFDFIRDGKPVILFPASYAGQGKLTKMTLEIANNVPYKKENGDPAELGYTRIPDIRIYNAP